MIPTLFGLLGSGAVAFLAWRLGSLSSSGALAAVAVGTVLFGAGAPAWFGTLLVFFFTSAALSRGKRQLRQSAVSGYEKGSRRDAGQVLANGGPGAVLCLVWAVWPSPVWWYAFIGVMASVTADTWATEIGALSRREPVTLIGWRRVPRGTSGAVSLTGTLAAAGGALVIGLSAAGLAALERVLTEMPGVAGLLPGLFANWAQVAGGWWLVPLALAGGLAGAFADSLLGATVQRMNRCQACGRLVEQASHCGRPAKRARGIPWMNNDAVNAISSAAGGLAALAAGLWIG